MFFIYVCDMKRNGKKIVNNIVLLIGVLLCFAVFFQQNDHSSLFDISTEKNSSSISFDNDVDLNEEELLVLSVEFLRITEKITFHEHFHFISDSAQPLFTVWQPPKLS